MRNLEMLLLASVLAFGACKRDRDREADTTVAQETDDLDRETATVPGPGPSETTTSPGPDTSYGAQPGTAATPGTTAGTAMGTSSGTSAGTAMGTSSGTSAGTAMGTATGSATPPGTAAGTQMGGTQMGMASDAADCPSAVKGAMTKITSDDTATAVVLAITSIDDKATREIRDRMNKLDARATGPNATRTSGATTGNEICPVILTDVTMTTKDVSGGVEVTLTPKTGAQTADLRQRVDDRIQATREWQSKQQASGDGT